MYLIVYKVNEFQHIHVADGNFFIHYFPGSPVSERYHAILRQIRVFFDGELVHVIKYLFFLGSLENRRGDVPAVVHCNKTHNSLKHLPEIHAAGNAQRI